MKHLKPILLTFISLSIFAFAFAQNSNVAIKGNIRNNAFEKVQLRSIQNNDATIYGEATIDQDGNFEIKGVIPETNLYRLFFSEKDYMLCCLTLNDNMDITLNAENLSQIIAVSGSKSMMLTKELSDTYQSRSTILNEVNRQLQEDKEQIYFNQINQTFVLFQRANKDIDDYVINAFAKGRELIDVVEKYADGGKAKKGKEDSLVLLSNALMKSFINDYEKFTSYMINIKPTYSFPPALNDKYADYNKFITQYMDVLDERHLLLINNMDAVNTSFSGLVEKRNELIISGKSDDKKSKNEFIASLIHVIDNNKEKIIKMDGEYLIKAQASENLSKEILDGAQTRLSAILKQYQEVFDKENARVNAKLKGLIQDNKDDLAVMMFLDIFPVEENVELHKSVATALYAKYPTNKMVENKYKQMTAPAISTGIGAVAPDIAQPNPEGKIMKLSDLRGKYVLIDFWASWCGPCRRENPHVVALYNKYKEKGFDVFSVSLDRGKDAWVNAIAADKLSWPNHVSDLKYWSSEAAKLYGVSSIPATFLIDKEGRIIAKNLRGAELTNALRQIFGE